MIIHTPDGTLIPPNRGHKYIEWSQVWDTALPSWLTSNVSETLSNVTASRGTVRATTGSTSGNEAKIETTTAISLAQFFAVKLTVESLAFDDDAGYEWSINLHGSAGGARVIQTSGATLASMRLVDSSGDPHNTEIEYRGREIARRNMSLWVFPLDKAVAFEQDGQFIAYYRDTTNWASSTSVKPGVSVITRESSAHWLELSKFRLDFWTS